MNIGVVAQEGNDAAVSLATTIYDEIRSEAITVLMDAVTAQKLDHDGIPVDELAGCALVVSIGGDGTLLFTARHVGSTPIIGVNLGEVGFLNAVPPENAIPEIQAVIDRIRESGDPGFREVPRLTARGSGWMGPPAINEIGVFGVQRGRGQGIEFSVCVDDDEYTRGQADGVLVATSSGSSAYNLSEGGPLVHPGVTGMVITEMCAGESMPSLVISLDQIITIEVLGDRDAVVASDGSGRRRIEPPESLEIRRSPEPARIAGPTAEFFRALEKLRGTW